MREITQNLRMVTVLFQFFRAPTDNPVGPIFAFNTFNYDVFLRKVVPLGLENSNLKFTAHGKFETNFKLSSCTQDRVVIFDSRVGFSGTVYLMASFKFIPG